MRGQTIAQAVAVVLMSGLVAACGGSIGNGSGTSSSGSGTSSGSSGAGAAQCATISLLASTFQLPSAASAAANGISLSAICKDSNNDAITGATVTFAASAGLLQVTQATTDASGTALATLTTGGSQANQTINVTATSGNVSSNSLPIAETGTGLQVSGPSVVGFGGQTSYMVTLANSSNAGIPQQLVTLNSALKNSISPASQLTNANGQATFTYIASNGGGDTLTVASANLNAAQTTSVTVTSTSLTFSAPTGTAATSPIPFNSPTQVQVLFLQSGAAVPGATITFSADRGTLSSTSPATPCSATPVSSLTTTTDANGHASVFLCTDGSQGAGGTYVVATVAGSGGPTASLGLSFEATTPATISVQASPSTIATSATSTVKAVVYDAFNNLVQGQTVDFTLTDPTGGSIYPTSGMTDETGSVSVTYTASTASSAQGGVKIAASVSGTNIVSPTPAEITVGGLALRIVLGTSNLIGTAPNESATEYQLPYSVLVTDSAGNPVPSASLNLTIQSIAYQKGFLAFQGNGWSYDAASLVPSSDPDFNKYPNGAPPPFNLLFEAPFGCVTEDPNNTGIYSASLDYNHNGVLDPGAVASVPLTVALDSTGSSQFEITYPKDHAMWVEELLTATAVVSGTESTTTAEFILPGLASDYENANIAPPGEISPYGDSANDPEGASVQANNCQSPD